jgi:hypothetical protein
VLGGADRDLARLAEAAQQLPCLERLDLRDVQVGTWPSASCIPRLLGALYTARLDCCAADCFAVHATPAPGRQSHLGAHTNHLKRMQVSSRGLQQLLALPRLVEFNAKAYCDDRRIPFCRYDPHAMQQRYDALSAAFTELCTTFRLAGRTLTTKLIRHPTYD